MENNNTYLKGAEVEEHTGEDSGGLVVASHSARGRYIGLRSEEPQSNSKSASCVFKEFVVVFHTMACSKCNYTGNILGTLGISVKAVTPVSQAFCFFKKFKYS